MSKGREGCREEVSPFHREKGPSASPLEMYIEGVRNGEDEKREFPLSNLLKGLGSVSQRVFGVEPRPKMDFSAFRHHRMYLVEMFRRW